MLRVSTLVVITSHRQCLRCFYRPSSSYSDSRRPRRCLRSVFKQTDCSCRGALWRLGCATSSLDILRSFAGLIMTLTLDVGQSIRLHLKSLPMLFYVCVLFLYVCVVGPIPATVFCQNVTRCNFISRMIFFMMCTDFYQLLVYTLLLCGLT